MPGKYLGARIGTLTEINKIIRQNKKIKIAIGGLINRAVDSGLGNVVTIKNDIEKFAFTLIKGEPIDLPRTTEEIAQVCCRGRDN